MENEWLIQELTSLSAFLKTTRVYVCVCVTHVCMCLNTATQQHQHRGTKWDTVQYTLNSKVKGLWTIFYTMNAAVVMKQIIDSSFREEIPII